MAALVAMSVARERTVARDGALANRVLLELTPRVALRTAYSLLLVGAVADMNTSVLLGFYVGSYIPFYGYVDIYDICEWSVAPGAVSCLPCELFRSCVIGFNFY